MKGVVGFMDAAQVLRVGFGAIVALQLGQLLDQAAGAGRAIISAACRVSISRTW